MNGILLVYYALSAIAIGLVLIRWRRRLRRERLEAEQPQTDQTQGQQLATKITPPEPSPADDAPLVVSFDTNTASESVESKSTRLPKDDVAERPPAAGTGDSTAVAHAPAAVRPSDAARTTSNVSWSERELFASLSDRREAKGGGLPKVGPGDVQALGTDDYVFGALTPTLAAMLPESPTRYETTRKELLGAGYHQPHAAQNLAAIRYVAVMAVLIFFGALLVVAPSRLEGPILALIVIGPLTCWALPRLYIKSKSAERIRAIETAMPDMLDMLNMCVSQGLTVAQALKRISRDLQTAYPALAGELRIVCEQADVGTLEQAMENFSERIESPEVHSFVALLTQTERMGTSVSDALTDYSNNMRESLRQRVEENGNRATFKLLFPTVLCLMPAVYIFLLGPALVSLSDFFGADGGYEMLRAGGQAVDTLNQNRMLTPPPAP